VEVAFFSARVGRPTSVIQPTTGSGDVAAGENRASTSVVADNDDVFGCRYLCKGIVFVVLIA
jgi:hypothetical protein